LSAEDLSIPSDLMPGDGRFGSGPSKVRQGAVAALASAAPTYLGTSHRREPVKRVVGRIREGLAELFSLPDGYEVILGNGGTTVLWDGLVFGFIDRASQHYVFGEFSAKFAEAAALSLHLRPPIVLESEPGTHPALEADDRVDVYALTHNETSTGVAMPVVRPGPGGLVAVDATSAAGGRMVDPNEFDIYYFAPQKCFAGDGGLWLALCSPAGVERIETLGESDRYIPLSLDLLVALTNSRRDQTYNTPALATLFLLAHQIDWMMERGGLEWAASRCDDSAHRLYTWADKASYAWPFVEDPHQRSHVVGTIDFEESVDAAEVARILRNNGIVDVEPYRKLGRNQLRVGLYPAVEAADVESLTRCIDYVVDALRGDP
jgi:phosphoserine aminotransferase